MAGALVLLGVACGSSNDDGGNGNTPTSGGNSGNGDAVATEEFGLTEEQLVASIEEIEASIASCMSDAGFEYVPIDPTTMRDAMEQLGTAPGLTDAEYVEQYGYGITTLPPTREFGTGEENATIRDALAPADQVAYDRTLLGEDTQATFMLTLDAEDFSSTGGCTRTAVEATFSEDEISATYLNPLDSQVEQDSRMVAAREQWAECIREDGYDYPRQEAAERELEDRLQAITGGADPATLTGGAAEELEALQADERAIALVDLECSEEFLEDVEEEILRDLTGREPT
jgi:hypothetical protein